MSDRTRTRIRYMTDGMLFRETLVDPLLSRYSVIMVRMIEFILISLSHPNTDAQRLMKRMSAVCTRIFYSAFLRSKNSTSHFANYYQRSCNRIRRKRPSLRIIVSSATLDASYFLDYFSAGNPPGEAFPCASAATVQIGERVSKRDFSEDVGAHSDRRR